jgi:hypothetical protein
VAGDVHPASKAGGVSQGAHRVLEALMENAQMLKVLMRSLLVAALSSLLWCVAGQAQSLDVSGRYECAQAKVGGKVVPCKAAPLYLKNDGRFEMHGREGSYDVTGGWVELTGALLKSRAKIEAGHRIVFRFYTKHGLCEMTYERRVAELGKTALS